VAAALMNETFIPRLTGTYSLERIIWRTSKIFVFGNGYNIVLATKPGRENHGRLTRN
jgi:hypothetical protein